MTAYAGGVIYRVGLTGGIASGKSTALRRLAELGAIAVDHDVLSREVVEPGTDGLAQIVHTFGPTVLASDGTLDRHVLGRIVFSDAQARERLNAIVHPRVRDAARAREREAPDGAVVVHDIPLLVETGQQRDFNVVVVVTAPEDVRAERLVAERGLTPAEADRRIASQAPEADRTTCADVVLDGSGTPEELAAQVDRLWPRISGSSGSGFSREPKPATMS